MKMLHKGSGAIVDVIETTVTNHFLFDCGEARGCEPCKDFVLSSWIDEMIEDCE